MRSGPAFTLIGQFYRPRRPQEEPDDERHPPFIQFQDTSYVPPAPKRRPRRTVLVFVVAAAGLALAVASMFLPWYTYTISGKAVVGGVNYEVYERADYAFNNVTVDAETSAAGFTLSQTASTSWSDYSSHYAQAYGGSPSLPAVYSTTLAVMLVGVTLSALGALLAFLFVQLKKRLLFPTAVILAAAALLLVSAVLFAAWHPSAVNADRSGLPTATYAGKAPQGPYDSFWGSAKAQGFDFGWGPAAGWYLALAAAAANIAGAAMLVRPGRPASE